MKMRKSIKIGVILVCFAVIAIIGAFAIVKPKKDIDITTSKSDACNVIVTNNTDKSYNDRIGVTSYIEEYTIEKDVIKRVVTDIMYDSAGICVSYVETKSINGQRIPPPDDVGILSQPTPITGVDRNSGSISGIESAQSLLVCTFIKPMGATNWKVHDIVVKNLVTDEKLGVVSNGEISIASVSNMQTWYFAEGCTQEGFNEYILIYNPSDEPVDVSLTFMRNEGNPISKKITVPKKIRYTVCVNDIIPSSAVATKVQAPKSVVVERSMYWNLGDDPNEPGGGHNSTGTTSVSKKWYFAEGCTVGSFDEWILILNPDTEKAAECTVTFIDDKGEIVEKEITVNPQNRGTVHVNDIPEMVDKSFSTEVRSGNNVGIVAERAVYWDSYGVKWADGHCSSGVPSND